MNCEHILVDGWNVIHAEPKLKKLLAIDAVSAQKALAEMLEPVHDMYSTRITIVYDGNGTDVSIVRPNATVTTFSEVYTPSSMTADEFIERYCALARDKSRIVVISNDNMIWETVSSFGAVCMRIGEVISYGKLVASDIKRISRNINFQTERQWQAFSPLAKLDGLELEINRVKSTLFESKKMQKRLKKIASSTSNTDNQKAMAEKKSSLAEEASRLKIHHLYKQKQKNNSIAIQNSKRRIPHIFKDFKELGSNKEKNKKIK